MKKKSVPSCRLRCFCLLCVCCLLLPLAACGTIEYAVVSEGNVSSEGFVYRLYENATAVITGGTPVSGRVVIPETVDGNRVTGIDASAFRGNADLYFLKICAPGVTLGDFAFCGCEYLTYADLGGAVSVGTGCFCDCRNLTVCEGTDSLRSVGSLGFSGCSSLCVIPFGKKLTSIGDSAFENCTALASVTLPSSLRSLGSGVFSGCTSLSFFDFGTWTGVPDNTFVKCTSLSGVRFGKKMKTIGELAFRGCTSLVSVTLPASLSEVKTNAFADCPDPCTVNYTGSESSWRKISFAEGNEPVSKARPYCKYKTPAASRAGSTDLWTDRGVPAGSYTSGSFTYALYGDGSAALTGVTSAVSVLQIPDSLDGHPVVSVDEGAFAENEVLTSVSFGANVETVCQFAFYECTQLSSVSGGSAVRFAGMKAFEGTPWLKNQTDAFVTFGDGVLLAYQGTDTAVTIPAGIRYLGEGAFTGNPTLTFADLGEEVVSIGAQCFSYCEALTCVYAPSVRHIGEYAFVDCQKMPSFDFSDRVETVGRYAFSDCYGLRYACPGKALQHLEESAFASNFNLRIFCVPSGLTELYSSSFTDCPGFLVLYPGTEEEYRGIIRENGIFYLSDLLIEYGYEEK